MILCSIPIQYKEGVFGISEFENPVSDMEDACQIITLEYSDYGKIVEYTVPIVSIDDDAVSNDLTLYGISKEELVQTLQTVYNKEGRLEKITAHIKNKDMLLYIYYENSEAAKQEIQKFALETADAMLAEIRKCKEEVSRLFVEYFEDGEAMDFHAGIGTRAEKNALEQKYPQWKEDIGDNFGNYSADYIDGDNDGLYTRVKCAGSKNMDFFYYAVEIMEKHIEENASAFLNRTEDFRFISEQYD